MSDHTNDIVRAAETSKQERKDNRLRRFQEAALPRTGIQIDFQQATLHYLVTDASALTGVVYTKREVMFQPYRVEVEIREISRYEPVDLQVRVYGTTTIRSVTESAHAYFDSITVKNAPDWVQRLAEAAISRSVSMWDPQQ